jgi:hypothetical protein
VRTEPFPPEIQVAILHPIPFDASFEIIEPGSIADPHTGIPRATADALDTVLVRVHNSGPAAGDTFLAQIFEFGTVVPVGPSKALLPEDATNQFYSARVIVGTTLHVVFNGAPNKTLVVTKNSTAPGNKLDFEAVRGIGSSGSVSGSQLSPLTRPYALSKTDRPVPIALSLQADAPAAGDAESGPLDLPTTLSYSGVSADECCWLSPPVDAFSDRAAPAFWVLRTGDARTWVLILRRGDSDVVVYHFTAPGEKGGAFPIQMHLAAGGRSWPRSVTVSPAL